MAGGDLRAFYDTPIAERPELSRRIISPLNRALSALDSSDILSVSSLHGSVAGAGMSIALMTDFAVAAEDVNFNFAYTKVAASPDCGGSYALVRLVGLRRALEIALLSSSLNAHQALALGLGNQVAPVGQLRGASIELARRLARGSRASLGATKRLLRQSLVSTLPAQLDAERESFAALSGQQDFARALETLSESVCARYVSRGMVLPFCQSEVFAWFRRQNWRFVLGRRRWLGADNKDRVLCRS